MDANFRLKNKDRNIKNDPALGDGWGHWVPEQPYHEYIGEYGYQTEVIHHHIQIQRVTHLFQSLQPNLCDSDLRAVDHANTKMSRGYTSTGVGGVLCARHTLVRKNGMGDLQKGERQVIYLICHDGDPLTNRSRYANMDFLVFFTLLGIVAARLVLSYDIVCQWSRNLMQRMNQLPAAMHLPERLRNSIQFVIPKFHIYGHGTRCQLRYSLNILRWSAQSNGEDPERWWAHLNPVSMSTRLMGPGARHDTLDDHAAAWNWRKITNFGTSLLFLLAVISKNLFAGESLLHQFRQAVAMRAKHQALFIAFTKTFSAERIQQWDDMVTAWEVNPGVASNPFEEHVNSECTSDICGLCT